MSPIQPKPPNKSCALTDPEIVYAVLTADSALSVSAIAAKYKLSKLATLRILRGQRYANLFPELPRRKPKPKRQGAIPDQTIVEILETRGKISNVEWADKLGYSSELISSIRRGATYARVAPHMPRQKKGRQTCEKCVHNIKDNDGGRCTLGFADRDGPLCPAFARESFLFSCKT